MPAPGVLGNGTDPDGDPLTATLGTGPTNGTATVGGNGSFTYTPNTGFVGADTFTYTASDGTATSVPATVTITVEPPPNAAPVTDPDTFTTVQHTPLTVATPAVLGNGTDADADPLTAALVAGPTSGTLALNANGSFGYTPNTAGDGTDMSAPATVTITVTVVACAAAPPGSIVGTAANNRLTGTPGDDLIYGPARRRRHDRRPRRQRRDLRRGGNDTLSGGDGNDRVLRRGRQRHRQGRRRRRRLPPTTGPGCP